MSISDTIKDNDLLGRGVFSQRTAKSAKKITNKTQNSSDMKRINNAFKTNEAHISVDRLGYNDKDLIKLQKLNASKRQQPSAFYGWLTLQAKYVQSNGRSIQIAPTQENPYHAVIQLPQQAISNQDLITLHLNELVSISRWLPQDACQ